jgi:ATP-dependent helicase HrpA
VPSPAKRPFRFRLDFPPELPISSRAEDIVMAIQAHQVVILAGETGSGKTTQIPKMCLAAGQGVRGRIACTQPRRVAALSISRRVAEELGVEWGREVGCKVRFSDQTSPQTVIKFLTDGMLLAEVQSDPQLRAYDTIILDEAHERSLNIDFLLGHLRNLRFLRPELKIIVTSATIDTQAFSAAFDGAPVVEVSGRAYPVEVIYAPLDAFGSDAAADDEPDARAEALHYVDGAVEAVERIVRESAGGDILVFMPSERDIREAGDLLDGKPEIRNSKSEIVPLFGRLSNAEQQRVFAPTQRRKIILATNIAETSLTIPGIRYVVDTGLARLSRYSPQARTRRLPIEAVAQSSADQRKGRAGRVAEGVCIRLYAEKDYLERPRFTQPEIQRANLADVILRLKAFGLGDIERFPFLNPPAAKAIRAGYALLEELGARGPARPPTGRAYR